MTTFLMRAATSLLLVTGGGAGLWWGAQVLSLKICGFGSYQVVELTLGWIRSFRGFNWSAKEVVVKLTSVLGSDVRRSP